MNRLHTVISIAGALTVGCASSAPQQQKPQIAPSAKKVGTKPTGAAPCDDSQEWGHSGTDPEVRKALDAHFAQRPDDSIESFHVLTEPSTAYPNASADKPVVTYRFARGGAKLVERAVVKRTDGGGWQVSSIAWSCVPQE